MKCPEVRRRFFRGSRPVERVHLISLFFCFSHCRFESGKWTNHKGRSRKFTNPDELEEQRKREEKERKWKTARGGDDDDDDESSEDEKPTAKGDKSNSDESGSETESDHDSDDVSARASFGYLC